MSKRLIEDMKTNRDKLTPLVEEYSNYKNIGKEHKKLLNDIKNNIKEFESYFEKSDGLIDDVLKNTGGIRRSFRELNDALSEQREACEAIDESITELSEQYGAPKDKIIEINNLLIERYNIEKELNSLSGVTENDDKYGYKKDLEHEKTINKAKIERTNLGKKMLEDSKTDAKSLEKRVELQESLTEKTKNSDKAHNQLNKKIEKNQEKRKQVKEKVGGFLDVLKPIFGLLSKGWDKFTEVDQATRDFGRTMGMSSTELDAYSRNASGVYAELAKQLGMEFKDMYKFQVGYAEATEKSVLLSQNQIGALAGLSRNTGEQAINTASKNLDVFASSADATIDYLARGVHRAAIEGLNVQKFSEAFANNIKLASRYTFKNGINGIQTMTLLSQRLKFNMESIGAAMDKFSTLEGAIEASAKLQVLGGSFTANFGNPLTALSEALTDAESFTKRIVNTVSNQAIFNQQTGEVNLSPYDKQRLKAAADALGIAYDELFNMSTQSVKQKEIERVMSGTELAGDEKAMAYLSNKAQFNQETRKWELMGLDGKVDVKDIRTLDKNKFESISQRDTHEKALLLGVKDLIDAVITTSSAQTSVLENRTKITEGALLGIANYISDLPQSLLTIISILTAVGSVVGVGAIGGMFKGFGRMLGVGTATGVTARSVIGTTAAIGATGVAGYGLYSHLTEKTDANPEINKILKSDLTDEEKAKKIDEYIQKENSGSHGIFGKKEFDKSGDEYVSEYNESHKDDFVFKAIKEYQEQKKEENSATQSQNILNENNATGAIEQNILNDNSTTNGDVQEGSMTVEEYRAMYGGTEVEGPIKLIEQYVKDIYEVIKYNGTNSSQPVIKGNDKTSFTSEIKVSDVDINVSGEVKVSSENGVASVLDGLIKDKKFKDAVIKIVTDEMRTSSGGRVSV